MHKRGLNPLSHGCYLALPIRPPRLCGDSSQNLRHNGVASSWNLCKIGRIPSKTKPMTASRSGSENHRISSVDLRDKAGTIDRDLAGGLSGKSSWARLEFGLLF